jgi:hypothetical protein
VQGLCVSKPKPSDERLERWAKSFMKNKFEKLSMNTRKRKFYM